VCLARAALPLPTVLVSCSRPPLRADSNWNSWSEIVGRGWTGASSLPIWYPHYDNRPSFSDFQSFGGWSRPSIKQYSDTHSLCGVGVDSNWYPSSKHMEYLHFGDWNETGVFNYSAIEY
jgi:hypothetical protein